MFQPKHENFTIMIFTSKYLLLNVISIINNDYFMFTLGNTINLLKKLKFLPYLAALHLKKNIEYFV